MEEHYYAVIMAGGGGTRLWPLSRQSRPKQMLRLIDERSLFQTSVQRLEGVFPPERILVVTVADQAGQLMEQCPEIPAENYLLEPLPRGTASVVGLAAVALQQRDPQASMAILTSDHYIGDEERFRLLLRAAYAVAQDDYLVTLGIAPSFPATGYGYIQRGEPLGQYGGLEVYRVARFKEKPDEEQARQMLASGDHAWNSGMFVWKGENILREFQRLMPELHAVLAEISRHWDTPERDAILEQVWPGIRAETIDYGIMEAAQQVAVIPAKGLNWSDVGSWDSLFDVLPGDQAGNIVMGGQHVGLDTSNSLVYVNQEHRLIVTIGVEDLVVVDTGDVLLVCRKDQAQKVRQVVMQLKQSGQDYT
ncbi:MAG TPA: mannose-1-phosphate guanylyltransferase [Anaerolineales bacterium]|nr:mannose-1-phosphate guanylyltransferase [Anaerolineales bacterium]